MARLSKKSLVVQLAEAHVAAAEATARLEALKAQAREQLAMGKSVEQTDNATVTVELQVNRTWNKAKAREQYGDDICTMQVDLTKARQHLTGEEFDSFYVEGAPKVIVKVD